MIAPVSNLLKRRTNRTLHGRSIWSKQDVSGHNVFKGYNTPGVGDGVDLFGAAGTPVVDCWEGRVIDHRGEGTKTEVIYIKRADGAVAVYGHIRSELREGELVKAGQRVGVMNSLLQDPHLHFECWMGGAAVTAKPRLFGNKGNALRDAIAKLCGMGVK